MLTGLFLLVFVVVGNAQTAMISAQSRQLTSLNGNWKIVCPDKPVFISEFGGGALYGSEGPDDEAALWTEDYQKQIHINQIDMFNTVPHLCGVCSWILFDYRSLGRMNFVYQKGYNRKGLLSEKGEKKKAWYIMRDYFKEVKY